MQQIMFLETMLACILLSISLLNDDFPTFILALIAFAGVVIFGDTRTMFFTKDAMIFTIVLTLVYKKFITIKTNKNGDADE